MMIQMTCRGYATAQFMQPEPAKYAHAPNLEAKTFMQPEQAYYAHHPGRFVYVKDEETGQLFSAPYEPVRAPLDACQFRVGRHDLGWAVEHLDLRVEMTLSLPTDDVAELWELRVSNLSGRARRISVVPYFPIVDMSWMNQSAEWREDLGGTVVVPEPDRDGRGLDPAGDIELRQDVPDVDAHGLLADDEVLADLAIRPAL